MRILFVSHSFPLPGQPLSNVGGMQRLAMEQLAALTEHPEVRLVSRTLESSARWTEVRTVPFLGRLLADIPRLVRAEGVQVVLFSSMVTASLSLLLRRRLAGTGAVLAATPVGRDVTLPSPVYQPLVPRIFHALDLVMPISRATGEECLARGLSPERMRVVPCGVDVERFPPVRDRAAARAELLAALAAAGEPPLPSDALLLCSVGRHQERKGFHWFVDQVMPRLPDNVVFLLGGGGPMTPAVEAAVARHGLQRRVRLLGRVPEETLLGLFRGSDLFVMPNIPVPGDIEGFGVVMLEAGLCGAPIVAAGLEGIRDVVRDGENGHLLPPRDAAAFAAAIGRYQADREALAALSRSTVRFTEEHFAWPRVVDQYLAALDGALGRAPAPAAPR